LHERAGILAQLLEIVSQCSPKDCLLVGLQLEELKQVKDSPIKSVMEKLSSARSEASSLSEQLAEAKHDGEVEHKEKLKLQKVCILSHAQ